MTAKKSGTIIANHSERKLRALPAQVIETEEGAILKRGVTAIRVRGDGSAAAVRQVLAAAARGMTREEILLGFAEPDREAVNDLVEQLLARRILMWTVLQESDGRPVEHSHDVFFWNFGCTAEAVAAQLNRRQIAIVGVNYISQRLTAVLAATGVSNFKIVDFHRLRNVRLFDDGGSLLADHWPEPAYTPVGYLEWAKTLESEPPGCLVVTSDFGGTAVMREWNRHCVEQGWHFLPVVLLDLIGYIGPLVIPGETSCYECLRARQNSHMEDPVTARAPESKAFEGQFANGFHPSMAGVLGDVAALELTKFYSGVLPLSRAGALIEVNLMVPSLVTRRVLKIPRCTVCSKMKTLSSSALDISANVQPE
jgi:bacteriocin biosynthesis cyclodehydratase domain-containing protein